MPTRGRTYTRRNANRSLARIEKAAQRRALEVAEFIVATIERLAPRDPLHYQNTPGEHLAESYRVRQDETTGDFVIWSTQPYWVFVEFGTLAHGGPDKTDAQPHVRPAIDLAKAKFR